MFSFDGKEKKFYYQCHLKRLLISIISWSRTSGIIWRQASLLSFKLLYLKKFAFDFFKIYFVNLKVEITVDCAGSGIGNPIPELSEQAQSIYCYYNKPCWTLQENLLLIAYISLFSEPQKLPKLEEIGIYIHCMLFIWQNFKKSDKFYSW